MSKEADTKWGRNQPAAQAAKTKSTKPLAEKPVEATEEEAT